jgi:sugar O-acyltransferase (sialic acid O-acetyltransferase NeuD family)
MRIAIIGASRLGQMIAHYAIESGSYEVVGFVDNMVPVGVETRYGNVLGTTDELRRLHDQGDFERVLIGVGYESQYWREKFFDDFEDLVVPRMIHPSAYCNSSAVIGSGTVALPRAVIDMHCQLGRNVFLNPGVIIAHDSSIDDHCFVGPGVNISGFTSIGRNCFIGVGCSVVNDVSICDDCFIGAGSVVTQSIDRPGTYVGTPARFLSENVRGKL